MGRPLFSKIYASNPVVREEPEPTPAPYEKWSRWNAFDPDSDEFFEDAVWESIVDPEAVASRAQEDPILLDMSEVRGGMVSNEGEVIRSSPMAVGPDDPARMFVEAYVTDSLPSIRRRTIDELARSNAGVPSVRITRGPTAASAEFSLEPAELMSPTEVAPIMVGAILHAPDGERALRRRAASVSVQSHEQSLRATPDTLPRTSNIDLMPRTRDSTRRPSVPIPYTRPHRRTFSVSHAPELTSTNSANTTPRLYVWSSHPTMVTPSSPSQVGGPLTNPSARMSLAHISPPFTRMRDLVA